MVISRHYKITLLKPLDWLAIPVGHHHIENDGLRIRLENDWSVRTGRCSLAMEEGRINNRPTNSVKSSGQRTAGGPKHRVDSSRESEITPMVHGRVQGWLPGDGGRGDGGPSCPVSGDGGQTKQLPTSCW